ncbi:MAG: pyridoxal 5'-phosphate synthase glutaminase subunit PdxT [Actinomycetota bacterium]|nr:pyridoxal 5'-phosphate synthase glutaminase subunit PdxT [Actinomycetota bacterium]
MSAAPVIGVLALQGDVPEHVRAVRQAGADARSVRRPEELTGLAGIVLPGGESTTMAKLAVAFGLLDPLRALLGDGLPAYGSCAGMILLADRLLDAPSDQRTLGGLDVTVRRNAFGRQVDSFEGDLDFPAVGDRPMHAVFIRAPWVEQAGPGVQTLASIPSGPAAGRIVAVRQGVLLATAFHPEMTGDTRVHELFVRIVRAA